MVEFAIVNKKRVENKLNPFVQEISLLLNIDSHVEQSKGVNVGVLFNH